YYTGTASTGDNTLSTDTSETTNRQSLDYLFNADSGAYKESHLNVGGLFQLNDNGYYEYDSQKNFASYDENSNSFVLYNASAVTANSISVADVQNGQFYPFNTASDVFTENNGTLQSKVSQDNEVLNHFFGVHSQSTFVQPNNGKVNENQDMTFEFSGDDDVWVFIDGVLVGDAGGLHDRLELSINFATGQVTVQSGASYDPQSGISGYKKTTTIKRAFDDAKVSGVFKGDTFADGTYHTLDFFYLERGAGNSNMKLQYNLVQPMSSEIIKVDQNGESLDGAEFELYQVPLSDGYTEDNFKNATDLPTSSKRLATGSSVDGKLVLTSVEDQSIINFDKLWSNDTSDNHNNSTYYALKETKAPDGYSRMLNYMKLKYIRPSASGTPSGTLVSWPSTYESDSSVWDTGAIARSKESITAPSTFSGVNQIPDCYTGNTCTTDSALDTTTGTGTMYAVVLRRVGNTTATDENAWHAVTGSTADGWSITQGTAMEGVVEAIQSKSSSHKFTKDEGGKWKATIEELPGYAGDYYYMLDNDKKSAARYVVSVYYSTAKDPKDVSTDNTYRVTDSGFERTFASRLNVPNIKNELFVQKVDENGDPVAGATFGLYKADQVEVSGNDTVTVKKDAENNPVNPAGGQVMTTNSWIDDNDPATPSFKGAAMFAIKSADQIKSKAQGISGTALTNGVYYLVEMEAPAGYQKTSNVSKIVVSDDGIFADAGEADDGIKVVRGVGQLVATMSTFGSTGSFDDTLRYVESVAGSATDVALDASCNASKCNAALTAPSAGFKTALNTAKAIDGKLKVSNTAADSLELTYGGSGAALQYGARFESGDYMFISDTDWPIIRTYQAGRPSGATEAESRTPLESDQVLSSIVTGSVMVQVTNEHEGVTLAGDSIKVSKTVKGAAAAGDFSFTLTADENAAENIISGLTDKKAQIQIAKTDLQQVGTSKEASFGALKFKVPTSGDAVTYTFTVAEEGASSPPSGWKYDQSEYTVTVKLSKGSDGTWSASVDSVQKTKDFNGEKLDPSSDVKDKVAAFTNHYVAVSSLPLTGGPSSMNYTWLALCIAGIGVLGWLSVNRWRNRHVVQ
ncbi:hypothetical protein BLEM_1718, partial [Bifidobacterium lemurum]